MGLEAIGAGGAALGSAAGSSAAGSSILGPLATAINESALVGGGAGGLMAPVTTQGLGSTMGMGIGSTLGGLLGGGQQGGMPPVPGGIMQPPTPAPGSSFKPTLVSTATKPGMPPGFNPFMFSPIRMR